jgi:hypothetical protein
MQKKEKVPKQSRLTSLELCDSFFVFLFFVVPKKKVFQKTPSTKIKKRSHQKARHLQKL